MKAKDVMQGLLENKFSQTIRTGMVMCIPVIIVGAFALMLNNIPFAGYKEFITTFGGGFIGSIFIFIYNSTFGLLSCYITLTLSLSYSRIYNNETVNFGAILSSFAAFFIFSGVLSGTPDVSLLSAKGIFSAIFAAMCSSAFYIFLQKHIKASNRVYTDGSDSTFASSIETILPFCITVISAAVFNYIFIKCFNVSGFQEFFMKCVEYMFNNIGRTIWSSILFIFSVHFMWFFGVHGNNVLEHVSQTLFSYTPELATVGAVEFSNTYFSKTMFDVFCYMGGSGATICILVALLFFAKKKSYKKLSQFAFFPMLFNINEIMIFGFPILYNPILFIPFILVPIVFLLTTTLAFATGFLDPVLREVGWTTPILLSGYLATGSIKGSIVQLVNLVLGAAIYYPFIKLYEKSKLSTVKQNLDTLIKEVKASEDSVTPLHLLGKKTPASIFANSLVDDLATGLRTHQLKLFYQPQYDASGRCIGVEALLRWNHPTCGMMYPPLVIALAKEADMLMELEKYVFETVAEEDSSLRHILGKGLKVSVNVSGVTIQTEEFQKFLVDLMSRYRFPTKKLCIEITEQEAVAFSQDMVGALDNLKGLGYSLAIDDFAMGHTSINYLKTNLFELVKLDGSLVKDMMANDRCKEIISSIVTMSQSLGFAVLSEYVETEAQKQVLEDLGCYQYQGYLFSPAVPLEKLRHKEN